MLREIGIKNFVLIEDLRLELDDGLNVLTGETGAGKSIVLDAIGLLLGDRFRSEMVRQGTERSDVDGIFDVPKTRAFRHWWDEHGFEKADEIVIRREGLPDGRSKAFLNDRPVTLTTLQELGAFLVDVHGQNEHQRILKPSVQMELLDRFAGLEKDVDTVGPLFDAWQDAAQAMNVGRLSEQERMQRLDLLRFQLGELESAKLKKGEDAELHARLPELRNAERLRTLAGTIYGLLYSDEGSALERVGQAQRSFEALKGLAPALEPLFADLVDAKSRLEETAHALQAASERWEADPEALEAALNRLDLISRLQKKYGAGVDEMLARAETLRAELDRLENSDVYQRELERKLAESQSALEKASQDLSSKRRKAAKEIGATVQKQLGDLGLKQAIFRCTVDALPSESGVRFTRHGIDRVTFEWAPNPGEGIQPLKAIASGGEMSRVMLALKTVLADADAVGTLVFDEVDAGIGGLTAQSVGKKLRALSRHHQVLCVSHLPQIASSAHAHFQVTKRVAKQRTSAEVIRLEPTERLHELARLLGSAVTPTSVQHAKEMLAQNQ
jgi:DNA repair protein RecN (Recombination protein N)